MVYGWGGLRTDGDLLSFVPSIPKKWKAFTYRLRYQKSIMEVTVDKKAAHFRIVAGSDLEIRVFGRVRNVSAAGVSVALQRLPLMVG